MKKTLFYAGAALAMVFSLNSCNKEIENPNENNDKKGIPFEIVANPVETRTENDGMDTKWIADDAINVFHAVTNSSTPTYVNDGEFTIDDPSTNKFNGELAEALSASAYDWFMFYPYNVNITTPANRGDDGYVTVGSMATRNQTQIGNGSKAHLAGKNVPLYGKIANVASSTMPSVTVNQICSFIEFNVTNNSGKDLTVTEIKFTGTEDVAGTYFIDFTGDNAVFTPSGDNYVSAIETLDVTDGAAIANGASAAFYMAIKPFSASSGVLKIAVNGYEKEINLTKATSFSAGKIKKININYDNTATTEDATYIFNTADGLTELGIAIPSSSSTGTSLDGKNLVKNGISLALSKGTGTSDPVAWKTSSALQLRTYLGNTLTFTAPSGYSVTEIKFSSNGAYTASTGTWNAPTWSGEASAVTLTRTGSGRHEVNTITVTCTKQAPKVLASIELGGNYQTEFYVNDTFDYSGLVVTAHYADGTQQQVNPTSVSSPDMSVVANNVPVTVTYTEGDVTKTATYSVNINERPLYVVTLGDDNTTLQTVAGGSVTLPKRSTVSGYTFEGWSTTQITEATTTAPSIISAGSYTPTASITLYPVFSSGEDITVWVRTDLSNVTAGDYILLTENDYAFSGAINSSGHGEIVTPVVSFDASGKATSIPNNACVITFIPVTGTSGFKMYNEGNGYLYAAQAKSGYLAWQQNENSYWLYQSSNWTYNSNGAYLRSYSDSSFRTYGQNNGKLLKLAKKTNTTSKSYISNPQ